jgi:hypothetical protein
MVVVVPDWDISPTPESTWPSSGAAHTIDIQSISAAAAISLSLNGLFDLLMLPSNAFMTTSLSPRNTCKGFSLVAGENISVLTVKRSFLVVIDI